MDKTQINIKNVPKSLFKDILRLIDEKKRRSDYLLKPTKADILVPIIEEGIKKELEKLDN